ncbi:MAG: hypothetical protein E2576_11145 [Alcaligenaceae bacterium]|nr:hypothetical protein [Alcaligenaceae bacterium SAGV5]MPS51236.1 hypothetical protein [Alcaligenaceae bacterium SAGV3]MPT57267.1 hypothetical protein [Alcaligenaceae bacterium]
MSGGFDIIGLVGPAESGKDTCAGVLAKLGGFVLVAFADRLRVELVEAFGVDPAMFTDRSRKELPVFELAIGRCADGRFIRRMVETGHDCTAARSPRQLMQLWGTEYRRVCDGRDYWTEQVNLQLHTLIQAGHRRICVSDVRFMNEAAYVLQVDGVLWRIRRDSRRRVDAQHESETQQEAIQCETVIANDARLEDFIDRVGLAYAHHRRRLSSLGEVAHGLG